MYNLSALEIHSLFMSGKISAVDITQYFLKRIEKYDPMADAFLSLFHSRALEKAHLLDRKKREGKALGKMAGVPIALKDNIHIHGEITTCASLFLKNYKAVFDASVTRFLEEDDALILGKTNLDEFAMGSFTENSAFKKTKNPWDLNCSPGGSSGGSSAAVAARLCPLALGSDTGGSIRQPAALTGTVGFKPSYGRVSRYGLVAFSSSLDQIGPLSTNVLDAAYLMETLSKPCKRDSTHFNGPVNPYQSLAKKEIRGMKVGIPYQFLDSLNPELKKNFNATLEVLKTLGVTCVEVNLDLLKYSVAVYYILATAEASTNLARYDGVGYGHRSIHAQTLDEVYELSKQEGFGPEVKNRILLGTYVLSSGYKDSYYKKAQQVRTLMFEQFKEAFSHCDLIAMPTSPSPMLPLGSVHEPLEAYLQDIYTIGANLTGLPAISIPSGFTASQKPLGFQLVGGFMKDSVVLQLAYHLEQALSLKQQIPPLFDKE